MIDKATESAFPRREETPEFPFRSCMTAFVSRRYRSPFIAQLPLTRNRISLPLQLAYDIREIALLLLVLLKRNDNHPTCICIIFAGHLDRHPVSPRTNSSFNYRHTELPRDVRIIPKKLYSRGETFLPRPAWSSGRAPATTAAPAAAADQPAHDQESDDSHGSPDDDVRHSAPRFLFFRFAVRNFPRSGHAAGSAAPPDVA